MSLDLCLKQLHVVHIKVFHRMQYYTFALVLLRHFPVRHFPLLQIPVTRMTHLKGQPSLPKGRILAVFRPAACSAATPPVVIIIIIYSGRKSRDFKKIQKER